MEYIARKDKALVDCMLCYFDITCAGLLQFTLVGIISSLLQKYKRYSPQTVTEVCLFFLSLLLIQN